MKMKKIIVKILRGVITLLDLFKIPFQKALIRLEPGKLTKPPQKYEDAYKEFKAFIKKETISQS